MINYIREIPFFVENITSINRTSIDSAQSLSMTKSQTSVINFDSVKEAYFKSFCINAETCSVDALALQDNGRWAFIEFKNGKMDIKERRNIRLKIKSSLLIFCDLINVNVDFTRNNLDLYLIYNHKQNPKTDTAKDKISNYVASKAKDEIIRFGLNRYNHVFFKNIYTYSEEEFQDVVGRLVSINENTVL